MTTEARQLGLVVASYGRRGILETADGERRPYTLKGRRLRVVCGDRVGWQALTGQATAMITDIGDRDNVLTRSATGTGAPEILAANLTLMALVVAPTPAPDFFLADRYLCAAHLLGALAAVIWNKSDLDASSPRGVLDYARIGYSVLETSTRTEHGLDGLQALFAGQTGILVGQSGVGKSSLVNGLVPDAAAAVGALSEATEEGTHTTTASIMHQLTNGGRLIDTPGVREFVPFIDEARRVQNGFPEIIALADDCRFADCLHLREPGCAVKEAVDAGQISDRRYESYRRLLRTIADL